MSLNDLKNKVADNVHQKYTSTDDEFIDNPPKTLKIQGKATNDLNNDVANNDFVNPLPPTSKGKRKMQMT